MFSNFKQLVIHNTLKGRREFIQKASFKHTIENIGKFRANKGTEGTFGNGKFLAYICQHFHARNFHVSNIFSSVFLSIVPFICALRMKSL